MSAQLTEADLSELRREHYNAAVTFCRHIHDDLMILRVKPDADEWPFEAGQYTTLGLGYWEPRARGCDEEQLGEAQEGRHPKRQTRPTRLSAANQSH